MRLPKTGFVAVILAASAPATLQAVRPDRGIEPGIYGNVRYHEESGDVSGIEIEIHADGDRIVETVLCGGICSLIVWSRYALHGDWIEYEYRESPDYIRTYRVRRDGRNVWIEQISEGYVTRTKLRRLKQRVGLDIATDHELDGLEDDEMTAGGPTPR